MSRGRGAPRGAPRGGRGFGNAGRGGFNRFEPQGPPDYVKWANSSMLARIPYFNAPIYLENKTQIGKVDEILGPITEVHFTVKLQEGMQAASFKAQDAVYIAPDKLLPLERFLPKPKATGNRVDKQTGRQGQVPKRGGGGGGFGRGAPRGGRGGFAPRGRGGFAPRGFSSDRGGRGGFGGRGGGGAGRGQFSPRGRGGRGGF
ncbi:hypothetical protein SmJEL517_g04245 [Synchytrium microbalum]|uniref:H/ACA ribonucleoprotein complex subunit n=1 Tax=Synchytrium microbalum TaxID=1806994 RepID=A0A507C016_9FUNG|nr:uncharacterized protein SmJEL517_g04245 [Synchytrium microbalum]TPX32708.1 hypothetical protein SmJEL517_g04245 [Synchytrium microbalum]